MKSFFLTCFFVSIFCQAIVAHADCWRLSGGQVVVTSSGSTPPARNAQRVQCPAQQPTASQQQAQQAAQQRAIQEQQRIQQAAQQQALQEQQRQQQAQIRAQQEIQRQQQFAQQQIQQRAQAEQKSKQALQEQLKQQQKSSLGQTANSTPVLAPNAAPKLPPATVAAIAPRSVPILTPNASEPLGVNQFMSSLNLNEAVDVIPSGGKPPYQVTASPNVAVTVQQSGRIFKVVAKEAGKTVTLSIRDSAGATKVATLSTIAIAVPVMRDVKGTTYKSICPEAAICNSNWNDYLLVGYSGKPYKEITIVGDNLEMVASVSANSGYSVAIVGKPTRSAMKVLVTANSYETKPASNLSITVNGNSNLAKSMKVIAAFNDFQLYGQCTWYAWHLKRMQNGQNEISAYAEGVAMQKSQSEVRLPRNNSILMNPSKKHTAYVESVTESTPIENADKSTTVVYTLKGKHANWKGRGNASEANIAEFTETMSVRTDKDKKSVAVTFPKIGYEMTHVYY